MWLANGLVEKYDTVVQGLIIQNQKSTLEELQQFFLDEED